MVIESFPIRVNNSMRAVDLQERRWISSLNIDSNINFTSALKKNLKIALPSYNKVGNILE